MGDKSDTCPLSQRELVDRSFMTHRNHILAVAAFLDRLDRSVDADADEDFRLEALREAIDILSDGDGDYVERVQMALSDKDSELLDERDRQNALGAAPDDG